MCARQAENFTKQEALVGCRTEKKTVSQQEVKEALMSVGVYVYALGPCSYNFVLYFKTLKVRNYWCCLKISNTSDIFDLTMAEITQKPFQR